MRPRLWLAAALGIFLGLRNDARALEHIRNEHFSRDIGPTPTPLPPAPGSLSFTFAFDADVTAADHDPAGGLTFYLSERDAGVGDGDQLVRVVYSPCVPVPASGTPVHFFAVARVACDSDGRLHAAGVWIQEAAWCDASGYHTCLVDGTTANTAVETSDPEAFELVIQDENRVEGANPTPEDVLVCSAGESPALHWAGSLEAGASRPSIASLEAAGSADLPAIFLAFDPQGTRCSSSVTPYVPFTFYVLARQTGILRCGISAAEFRIEGLPSGWFANQTLGDPSFRALGDPLAGGVDVVLQDCSTSQEAIVVLYRLDVYPTSPVSDRVLSLEPRTPPINEIGCAELLMCNIPYYTQVCVGTGSAILNPSPGSSCDQTVPATPSTWSQVKGLYRD